MELNTLRWQALGAIGVSYQYIKNYLRGKFNVDITELNLDDFSKIVATKYPGINQNVALFDLEDSSYRRLAIFSLRDKECDELKNVILRQNFIQVNRLGLMVDNVNVRGIDEVLYPCFLHFDERYVEIKMAQLRSYTVDVFDEDNVVTSVDKTYYHCTKFIIDLDESLVFLFYNDINGDIEESSFKAKAITEKKQAFYGLFTEGTQNTLLRRYIDSYLNKYVKEYLEYLQNDDKAEDECDEAYSIVVIETADPIEVKNNLRSSKKDGRHNEFRLGAIQYALEHEDHTVKSMDCNINGRWFQFKNHGEIVTKGPYFSREVIESVCEQIFPDYRLSEGKIKEGC
jgi:hypothetical protein